MNFAEKNVADESCLKKIIASFLLKLQVIHQVPVAVCTINEIVTDFNEIHHLSVQNIFESVQQICAKYKISEDICCEISKNIHDDYPFYKLTNSVLSANETDIIGERGELSSQFLRNKYVKNNFPYVRPLEVELGYRDGKHRTFMYISIPSVLRELLLKTDVLSFLVDTESNNSEFYINFRSGSVFKENPLLQTETCCIVIGLYQDDFETVNPIGSSKKLHKICAFYWVMLNVPYEKRSTLYTIQNCILCKSADVKYFGLESVLKPLLRDLRDLETVGVYVDLLGKDVKGVLGHVSADNLGAHTIGGFYESFNVSHFCRFCLIDKGDLQNVPALNKKDFRYRTKENYSFQIQRIFENPELSQLYGIKKGCALNESLEYFNIVEGLPPDICHDLLEGIVPYEIALCLSKFIRDRYFTLSDFNNTVVNFPYKRKDSVNKPQVISNQFISKKTIGGNATENRTLLRLLPLLIGEKIPVDDPAWEMLLLLKRIVEICFAPVVHESEISFLDCQIHDHLTLFHHTFPNSKILPKHHFVQHYPEMIKKFGPLVKCCTIRFEGKHKYFKSVVKQVKCFKNICKTLSEQHQLSQACYLASPKLFKPEIVFSEITPLLINSLLDYQNTAISSYFDFGDNLHVTGKISIDSVDYVSEQFLAYGKDVIPQFGKINLIILRKGLPYFLLLCYTVRYNDHLGDFEGEKTENVKIVRLVECIDKFPLNSYVFKGREVIPLKHWLSVS